MELEETLRYMVKITRNEPKEDENEPKLSDCMEQLSNFKNLCNINVND
jgi:hypothetical protein